jgi:hypothetical protein
MPVWAVLLDGYIVCSTSPASRKAKNVMANPAVTIATDDPTQPVIIEGSSAVLDDPDAITRFAAAMDSKYQISYGAEFYLTNTTLRIEPIRVFGFETSVFTGTPTRWIFGAAEP